LRKKIKQNRPGGGAGATPGQVKKNLSHILYWVLMAETVDHILTQQKKGKGKRKGKRTTSKER
jgi:hypothetical protein